MPETAGSEFSDEERLIARGALGVYKAELDFPRADSSGQGESFVEEFTARPSEMWHVLRKVPEHLRGIRRFEARVKRLGVFVASLEVFADRPVTHVRRDFVATDEEQYSFEPVETQTIAVTPTHIQTYQELYTALGTYATTIRTHELESGEVEQAARTISQIMNPDDWRHEPGITIPKDARRYTGFQTKTYLEIVTQSTL